MKNKEETAERNACLSVFLSFYLSVFLSVVSTDDKVTVVGPAIISQARLDRFPACTIYLDSLVKDLWFASKMIHIA